VSAVGLRGSTPLQFLPGLIISSVSSVFFFEHAYLQLCRPGPNCYRARPIVSEQRFTTDQLPFPQFFSHSPCGRRQRRRRRDGVAGGARLCPRVFSSDPSWWPLSPLRPSSCSSYSSTTTTALSPQILPPRPAPALSPTSSQMNHPPRSGMRRSGTEPRARRWRRWGRRPRARGVARRSRPACGCARLSGDTSSSKVRSDNVAGAPLLDLQM
jgi:hypothetical protein